MIEEKAKRLMFIDVAKAIAMFFVLFSHTNLGADPINRFICSFHMPLFFFLSGYTQKNKVLTSKKDWLNFLAKKFATLLTPYFLCAFITQTQGNLFLHLGDILYASRFTIGKATISTIFWFLPCLFASNVLYQMIINLLSIKKWQKYKKIILPLILCILAFFGFYFNYYHTINEIGFPFSFNVALIGTLFMFIGNITAKFIANFTENRQKAFLISIILLIIGLFISRLNTSSYIDGPYDFGIVMAEAWYGSCFIFLPAAIFSCLGILFFSIAVENKVLAYFGRNTIAIMLLGSYLYSALHSYFLFIPDPILRVSITCLLVMLICSIFFPVINYFFPNVVGKFSSK